MDLQDTSLGSSWNCFISSSSICTSSPMLVCVNAGMALIVMEESRVMSINIPIISADIL